MSIDEFCAEVPHLPTAQARAVYIYRESGWEWMGDDGEGNIEMRRARFDDTMDAIFITPRGISKEIRPEWFRNK